MKKRILGFLNHSQILSLFSFFIISILNTHTFLRYFFKSSMIFEIKNSIICCTNVDTKIPISTTRRYFKSKFLLFLSCKKVSFECLSDRFFIHDPRFSIIVSQFFPEHLEYPWSTL